MIWGGAATILGMIFQPLGQAVAWLAWVFLEWTIVIVEWTASLPLAAIEIGKLDTLVLAGYYLILFGLTRPNLGALSERFSLRPALAAGAALMVGVLLWNVYATVPDGKMRGVFVDADSPATFVQTPRGSKILIDGGASPSALLAVLGQRMPFWDRQIDLMVLTCVDDLHLAGLVETLERYEVKQIVQVGAPSKASAASLKWDELITTKRIPSAWAEAGLRLAVEDGVTIEFFSPPPNAVGSRPAIAQLRTGQVSFLFADEASVEEQAALRQARIELASTVLIAPKKIAPEFIRAVNPQYAILFTGPGIRSAPSPDLISILSGTTIMQTEDRGTIEMIVDGPTLSIRTAR